MSSSRLVGLVLLVIGYLSGAILVVQPFVPQIEASLAVLATLFPLCLLLGLPLYAADEHRSLGLRGSAWILLTIGLASLVGIFVDAVGLARGSQTLTLWILMPGCLSLGLLLAYLAGALDRVNRDRLTGTVTSG